MRLNDNPNIKKNTGAISGPGRCHLFVIFIGFIPGFRYICIIASVIIDFFLEENAFVFCNTGTVAVAVYLDYLPPAEMYHSAEKQRIRYRIRKYAEIYPYAHKVAEHSAHYQSYADYNSYLELHLVGIKVYEHKAYHRRKQRMYYSQLQRIGFVEASVFYSVELEVHYHSFHDYIQRESYFYRLSHTYGETHQHFRCDKADKAGEQPEVRYLFKELYKSAFRIVYLVIPVCEQRKDYEQQISDET